MDGRICSTKEQSMSSQRHLWMTDLNSLEPPKGFCLVHTLEAIDHWVFCSLGIVWTRVHLGDGVCISKFRP